MNARVFTFACLLSSVCIVSAADVAFGGPEVLKLDWATRSLNVSDLNGDGLNDLAVVNQDTAKIELLHQRSAEMREGSTKKRLSRNRWEPVLEDAHFDRDGIAVGFPVFDLAVGDLNGDGRADIAYTAREVPLTIRYQGESGQWADSREFDNFEALGWTGTLKIEDLNGDGRAELVVIAADAVRVVSHDAEGRLADTGLFYLTGNNPYNLLIEDVDEDGLEDILYITASGKQSLAYRKQLVEGGFGPERRFIFERPVRSVLALPRAEDSGDLQFCAVDSRTGSLEFFHLKRAVIDHSRETLNMQPEIYPIFKKGRASASYAMGDLSGDGARDIVIANPSEAEVVLFLKNEAGFGVAKRFPSFSAISSMVVGTFFDEPSARVVMVSADEKMIGHSHLSDAGRLHFPKALQVGEGDPVVCEVLDYDADGMDELVLISEQAGKYTLKLARPTERSKADSKWEVLAAVQLSGVKRKPVAIKAVDVFGADRRGLMVFVPREAPLLFLADTENDERLVEVAKDSPIRQNLLKDLDPTQVSVFDLNNDGLNELVVGRKGYARAIQVTGDSLEMIDQFNARQGEDVVTAVIPLYEDGRVDRLLFYISSAGELQSLQRGADEVFRYEVSEEVGQVNLLGWRSLGEAASATDLVLMGDSQFWLLSAEPERWSKQVESNYETELEDVHYTYVEAADFNADGDLELLAVDGQKHVVEILTHRDGEWLSQKYWEIFEQNMHYQGRTGSKLEPRQAIIADLTGDGHFDFAFLLHDRILFYPQE